MSAETKCEHQGLARPVRVGVIGCVIRGCSHTSVVAHCFGGWCRFFVLGHRELRIYDDESRTVSPPKAIVALADCSVRVASLDTFNFVLSTPNDVRF